MSIISTGSEFVSKGMSSLASGRFTSDAGKITRKLNQIAIRETKGEKMVYTFSKALPEDLKRLTSKSIKDSYKRVTWTNPENNKVYHILEESRNNGKVQVRILDKDGAFIKNAELTPKNIVIFDNFYSLRGTSHGEMMETLAKRFNPFANIERLKHKDGFVEFLKYRRKLPLSLEVKRFKELEKEIEQGKKVDYISISESNFVDIEDVMHKGGKEQQKYVSQSVTLSEIRPVFEKIISKGTRIFESSGNESNFAKEVVSDQLAIEGVEGVGSLVKGKIAKDSSSRNSVFTQHYERRNYYPKLSRDENGKVIGINITGLTGTDIPLNWKTKKLVGRQCGGTSYSTPVRVAKEALNDMMKDIELP